MEGCDTRYKIGDANTKLYKVYKHYRKIMGNKTFRPDFEEKLEEFKQLVLNKFNGKTSTTFVHFGDGDYYFLSKISLGSAMPKRRALSVSYDKLNMVPFKEGFLKNNYVCVECFEPENEIMFNKLYPSSVCDYPTEYIYGLLSSKWFLKMFKGNIGLIGADTKLDLIKKLLEKEEYKEYLGTESFTDYIKIPQKFACDDLEKLCNHVKTQLQESKTNGEFKIFLCGMGHLMSGLFHRLKEWQNGLFIDVGSGIDALAGIVDHNRPYMATWTNYHLKNYDYSKLDFLQYKMSKDKGKIIIK